DGLGQQALELAQIVKLAANVLEVMRGNRADFATGSLFGSPEPDKGADFVDRAAQLARPPNEGQHANVGRVVDAAAGQRSRGCERRMDREFDAAGAVSNVLHRGDGRSSRLRLLARLPLVTGRMRRGCGLCTSVTEPAGQVRAHRGNGARCCGVELRFPRTPAS